MDEEMEWPPLEPWPGYDQLDESQIAEALLGHCEPLRRTTRLTDTDRAIAIAAAVGNYERVTHRRAAVLEVAKRAWETGTMTRN
jgi:hypothetical protein